MILLGSMRLQNQQHHPYLGEYKKVPNVKETTEEIDEFEIFALAKRQGITSDEMKNMSFVSLFNVLVSNLDGGEKDATEDDIRRMFG